MPSSQPLVSVLFPTYNHAPYVATALRGVLGQTLSDLEVVVVDDGSTDGTDAVLDQFTDPRIVRVRQANSGPSNAINAAVRLARGQYVAQMSGDDVCLPDRLERQLAIYREGPRRLLFSTAEFIDAEGRPVAASGYQDVFQTKLRTQADFIRQFFDRGNCVNAVTAFTEREVFASRPFDVALYQTQDFDMWAQLIKQMPLEVDPVPTIQYRILGGSANLSSLTPGKYLRIMTESLITMRRFFHGMSDSLFRAAFGDRLRHPDFTTPAERACEEALLYLGSPLPTCRILAVERLVALLNDPATTETLRVRYGYDAPTFARALLDLDLFNLLGGLRTHLYVDTGAGFNHTDVLSEPASLAQPDFSFTFDTTHFSAVRGLRWDPLEGQLCRVRLTRVEWTDLDGRRHRIDPLQAEPNGGQRRRDGSFSFSTIDPWFTLPITGPVATVTVAGIWVVEHASVSLNRALTELARLDQVLAHRYPVVRNRPVPAESSQNTLEQEVEGSQRLGSVEGLVKEELPAAFSRIAALEAQLAAREAELALARRDLAQLACTLAQREGELAYRESQLAETEQQLDAILSSKRWKLVNGLRTFWRRITGRAA
jgi:hypothetical protein